MFDPTAFDNMKVVIEGAIYDRDSAGEIIITDRNDFINLAKMSRLFNICITLPEISGPSAIAKLELESKLDNLAAELLSSSLANKIPGCFIRLQFFLEHSDEVKVFQDIEAIFTEIWGETRKITQAVEYNPLAKPIKCKNVVTVDFIRVIGEEQLDDIVEMTDFMVVTLKRLQGFLSGRE
jgi:hypothetical protein